MTQRPDDREVLQRGELTVLGRIRSASNATFLCEATLDDHTAHCVYKPVSGEQPLWDFPDGTLAGRELCAYLVSRQLGWNIVPYTIIRHGPAGPGMLQLWIDQPGDAADSEPEPGLGLVDLVPADTLPPGYIPVLRAYDYAGDPVSLVHADDIRLRRMAVFDVLINNADRKGGHLARRRADGRLLLRESAQCPAADEGQFQDITRHRFFNTNNLWIRLDHLKAELTQRGGVLPLALITNVKTVDPRVATSPKVIQIESAMGAAIACFAQSGAVVVPRSRFAPVKTTADLLALRSD